MKETFNNLMQVYRDQIQFLEILVAQETMSYQTVRKDHFNTKKYFRILVKS